MNVSSELAGWAVGSANLWFALALAVRTLGPLRQVSRCRSTFS
ncbi:MAG TPA: hypothetical protein VJ642_11625 [Chromobacteriaceae bacterium]|nr:hypothetical protein [Chromobacteriaceae bacterium]